MSIERVKRADVVFLCSNATHVAMFEPVVTALRSRRLVVDLLSLDAFYGHGAGARAADLGLAIRSLPRHGGPLSGGFYDRPVLEIWRDVIAARRPVERALAVPLGALVVGNDFGLIEKLVLGAARSNGAATVLVQDGRLSPTREEPATRRAQARSTLKRALSPMLEHLGLGALASSEYGGWGVDVICAAGPAGGSLLRRRSPRSKVIVTGQPRYDGLLALSDGRRDEIRAPATVAMFTTPFAADRLGPTEQARQESLAVALAVALRTAGHDFVLKPHPRESAARYAEILGPDGVSRDSANQLLARSTLAIVGISSVVEEAGLLGVPVVVPGDVVHGRRFDARLPDARAYPRFETAEAVVRLLEPDELGELRQLGASQGRRIRTEIAFDPASPAGDTVADAIAAVVGERNPARTVAEPAA